MKSVLAEINAMLLNDNGDVDNYIWNEALIEKRF